ncbi:MAG TPA: Mut7-C RNAse domain-containing protein [Ignavibacteriales bacterium]|nr:Mut7-C RNAse domain-containing protein [Ignavibacteriales bacterium]
MHRAFFRFYEELNDFLPEEKRKVRFTHFYTGRTSVKDMIESLGVPHSEIDLILVNGHSADFSYIVQDDDDISVYPVFESFDLRDLTHLRQKPLRKPKFVADVHLGKLARYMRMLGLDTIYDNNYAKDDLVNISIEKKRTILTRDRNILKRNDVTHGYWVRSEEPIEQAHEVIERFHLEGELKEFSRCMECNGVLETVNKEDILEELPPKVEQSQTEFYRCPNCRRIYWKGTHYEKMKKLIGKIEGNQNPGA